MGLRFRRSVKIMPGVRVNLGKKGASVSVGRRGANMTMGKNGVRTTVGLPGTGLSHTTLHRRGAVRRRQAPQHQRKSLIPTLLMIALGAVILSVIFSR